MQTGDYLLPFILTAGIFLSVKTRKLTLPAALTAALLGLFLYSGAGYYGILMAAVLFLMAALATSQKRVVKEALGAAEKNKGQRKAGQVVANAGLAGLMGLLCFFYPPETKLLRLMMAAALASAAADTVASELGTVYGKRFYNIISLKQNQRGLDGVISLEGTLLGVAASAIIALVYSFSFGWNFNFWLIVLAATVGNLSDSVLGATLERKGFIGNNTVNFLNTLIAAVTVSAFYFVVIYFRR
ncbi:MAG: DUF92 domain-containing protein [Sphingobacteriaceae bacterium]|nr:MAG: DUF92 domain-containing protein [Sphingobacteriaceae bacterium]